MKPIDRLRHEYIELRRVLLRIDWALEGVPDAEIKEYDKALTVMKVGAKVLKRELARHGHTQLGRAAKELNWDTGDSA